MLAPVLSTSPNPAFGGATALPLITPGAYTTSGPYTTTAASQLSNTLVRITLSLFNSDAFVPVFSPPHTLSFAKIANWIQALSIQPTNPLSKFTPNPLTFKQANPEYSTTLPCQETQAKIKNFANQLQEFTQARAWPQNYQFPTIVFLPQETLESLCQQTNTPVNYGVTQLQTGEILVAQQILSAPKELSFARAKVQQTLLQNAFGIDPATDTVLVPELEKYQLAPGVFVQYNKDIKDCGPLPQGLDCMIPQELLEKGKIPKMYSVFKWLYPSSNPSLVGFADILSRVVHGLANAGFDLSKKSTVISMGAGVAADREIFSKLLPSFSMVAVDPEYKNPETKALTEGNLKAGDLLVENEANQFIQNSAQLFSDNQPGLIVIRNIFVFHPNTIPEIWGQFFQQSWNSLKEQKALAMVITSSERGSLLKIRELLATITQTDVIAHYNDVGLKIRGLLQDKVHPDRNNLIYATGPDSWFIVLSSLDAQNQ